MPAQIKDTPEEAKKVFKRYYRDPALFMEEILRMDLDTWQREICDEFHNYDRFAISSGHSSGKSAVTAGLIIFFMTHHPSPQIIVTANTENQLKQKTWRELAKWHKKSLIKNWFNWTATSFQRVGNEETWFAAAVPQTEHNSEAFAGAHERYVLQIFDEASAIPGSIYEVAEGATATEGGYRKWFLFGNPTQNAGEFYESCFGRQTHRWHRKVLDTRTCKYADQEQIKRWEEDYGEDSDFFRVRVLGLPPQQSITTLIAQADVDLAYGRNIPLESYYHAPKILGVDCARFGDDETVLCYRQGLKLHWIRAYRGLNEIEIANKVAKAIREVLPQMTFFDNTGGYGAGAYDIVKNLGYTAIPINFSAKKEVDEKYLNMRMQMWDGIREWIAGHAVSLPADADLARELVVPEYFYNKSNGKKQLEAKEDIKEKLGRSPDRADALALTFAYPVAPVEEKEMLTQAEKDWRIVTGHEDNQEAFHVA